MPGEFSFAPLSGKERAQVDRSKREIEVKSKKMLETVATCLSSDNFASYREEYAQGKEELIRAGIGLDYSNPIAYAQLAHAIFMRLDLLGKLEEMVQSDLRKVNKV